MICNIRSPIQYATSSSGVEAAMAQPQNDPGSFDKNFFHSILQELISSLLCLFII
jgi:hypothetical protein